MEKTVRSLQRDSPTEYLISIISILLLLVLCLMLSISSLFMLTSIGQVRCWSAVGESFSDGWSNVQLATGRGIGGNGFIDFAVEYVLPVGEVAIERIQLHGPIVRGVDPAETPVAYTFCGESVSCVDLETETCLRERRGSGCGRIVNRARALGPNDTPTEPNGRIIHLAEQLEEFPQRFYINITSTASPSGIHRGFVGSICTL